MQYLLFTTVAALAGIIGYAFGARYKHRYLEAAEQLANLRGENFQGQLTTISAPQAEATSNSGSCEKCAELRKLHTSQKQASERYQRDLKSAQRQVKELEHKLATESSSLKDLEQQLQATKSQSDSNQSEAGETADAWQLQQLHREQIQMQLMIDDYAQQIAQLRQELAKYEAAG